MQIYVRPWWHYSCDLHFKPATVASNKPFYIAFFNTEKVVCMLLNQQVFGATDVLYDQGH